MTAHYGTAEVTLPSDREFLITRVFDAPAEPVFDVWTSPDAVPRWWSDANEPVRAIPRRPRAQHAREAIAPLGGERAVAMAK